MAAHNRIDLTGQKINFLTVLRAEKSVGKYAMWLCKCDCGREIVVAGRHLYSKGRTTRSCRKCLYKRITKHGMVASREHQSWEDMKQRCNNPNNGSYPRYGGVGISVCAEWNNSFKQFFKDMGRMPSGKHTIDRFPNKFGNYEPGNCRWATPLEQNRNQKSNRVLEIKGEKRCLSEWCEMFGIKYTSVWKREKNGWDIIDAITTPKHKKPDYLLPLINKT